MKYEYLIAYIGTQKGRFAVGNYIGMAERKIHTGNDIEKIQEQLKVEFDKTPTIISYQLIRKYKDNSEPTKEETV